MTDNDAGEAATPVFDAVQRYIAGLRAAEADTGLVADRLGIAIGNKGPEVPARLRL